MIFFATLLFGALAGSVLGAGHTAEILKDCPLCADEINACAADTACDVILTEATTDNANDDWEPSAADLTDPLFVAAMTCAATGCPDDDDDDCDACDAENTACAVDATCRDIGMRMAGGAAPSADDMKNEAWSATMTCNIENCAGDDDDSNGDDCDACAAEGLACALDAACVEIGMRAAGGAAPSADDFANEKFSATMACHMENCPGDDDDGDECPECSAATTACFLDADCGSILALIGAEERYPNGEELKNKLVSTMMTCHNENCAGDDDGNVLGCLSENCPAAFDTCMGGDCAAEMGAAMESDTGPPTPEFVAAQSADFQALHKCYLIECEDVDREGGHEDHEGHDGDANSDATDAAGPSKAEIAAKAALVTAKAEVTAACATESAACTQAKKKLVNAEQAVDQFESDSASTTAASLVAVAVAAAAALF